MKTTLILFLICSSLSFGQNDPIGAIEHTDFNILYRGYSNQLAVAVTNNQGGEVILTCSNCDTIYPTHKNNYIIKPGNRKTALLKISIIQGDSVRVVKEVEYRVSQLPNPTLFWGAVKSGQRALVWSRLILAKYTAEIPLKADFHVKKWKMTINGESCDGTGSNLSSADEFLKTIIGDGEIMFEAEVVGPDGLSRTIYGKFPYSNITPNSHIAPKVNDTISKGCG
jgi:hypothetical protein